MKLNACNLYPTPIMAIKTYPCEKSMMIVLKNSYGGIGWINVEKLFIYYNLCYK